MRKIPVYKVTRDELKSVVNDSLNRAFLKPSPDSCDALMSWINTTDKVLFGATIGHDGYICQCPIAGYQKKTEVFNFESWQSSFAYIYDVRMNELLRDRIPIRNDVLNLINADNEETTPGVAEIV